MTKALVLIQQSEDGRTDESKAYTALWLSVKKKYLLPQVHLNYSYFLINITKEENGNNCKLI